MIPVTNYPVATQRLVEANRQRIAGKPYAHFFHEDLWLREEVLPHLKRPMDPSRALRVGDDLNRLLEPGHLDVETGYCALPDGSGYTTSLTRFPGATAEMFRWWFWWHSVEAERYTLWFPWNHVSAIAQNRDVLTAPGLTDAERYIGNVHHIDEYIGPDLQRIAIEFVPPHALGLDEGAMAAADVHGSACGYVWLRRPRIRIATMVHLIRDTDEGFELRSRYFLGDRLLLGRGERKVGIDRIVPASVRSRLAGERLAYEQLLHDQIEFTHLASLLPDLYSEFGPGRNADSWRE